MFVRARWRLVASYMAILAVILIGLSFAVFTIFQSGLYGDIDPRLQTYAGLYSTKLADRATVVAGSCLLPNMPLAGEANETVSYTVVDCNRTVVAFQGVYIGGIYPEGLSQALAGQSHLRTVGKDGHYWRVYSTPITWEPTGGHPPIGALEMYVQVDAQVRAVQRLEQVLIGGGITALLLAGAASLFLAGRTLAPIRTAFTRERRFIADASHELRTPLTLIRSSAEMVSTTSRDRLPAEDAELLDDIVNEVDRMSRLVTDLLTLARVDHSQIRMEEAPVDMAELVQQVQADVEPLASQKGVINHASAKSRQIVIGDEMRLRQLLLILLDNAIKYTEPGGSVETSVAVLNGHVSLSVQDTGVGISSEALPHIFERFYRADDARTHESGGAGLGLSIAAWIVRAHHGKIHIDSIPKEGTRITVELPSATRRFDANE